ncbi:hypothetical protein PG993_008268 [Apiospora rasikravindrae]|uniref:Heterokaryon incompatibility domain-containing protein n=1 Tax=Apiospora rasikravindrae TaxID=990691 RepID=A0ABR1SZV8_9PEZI
MDDADIPTSLLCDRCQKWDDIDIHAPLGPPTKGPLDYSMPAEQVSNNQSSCMICQADENPVIPLFLNVDVTRDEITKIGKSELRITPQFKFHYARQKKSQLRRVENWDVNYFDVVLLRRWIGRCDNVHRRCNENQTTEGMERDPTPKDPFCSPTADETKLEIYLPDGFRVIDVVNLSIHQPAGAVRFVALSYMWKGGGKEEFQLLKTLVDTLKVPGSLASVPLPGILTDAMALCKDLNESYLWVDRLCIIQDDPASKMRQIQAMDAIYRSATFTIAAALNENDGVGLPGYKNVPRYPTSSTARPVHEAAVTDRGFYPNSSDRIVSSSRWNTRGWTFQERLLSRRTIFVTEHEVRFECPETRGSEPETWSLEDMELLPHVNLRILLRCKPDEVDDLLRRKKEEEAVEWAHGYVSTQVMSAAVDWTRREPPTLVNYCRWVEEYTRRQLTFPSDTLHAFAGAAKIMSGALVSRMLFGLPERCLPQALMWEYGAEARDGHRSPPIQLDGLSVPSWSWAHRMGPAQYRWMDSQGETYRMDDYR